MKYIPTTTWHVRAVFADLSDLDAMEIVAAHGDVNEDYLVVNWLKFLPYAHFSGTFVDDDNKPLALLALTQSGPVSLFANLVTCPAFAKIARSATRLMLRQIRPEIIPAGITRIECRVHEDHRPAIRWLEFLGAGVECRVRGLAPDGSDFIQYAWTNPQPKKETSHVPSETSKPGRGLCANP